MRYQFICPSGHITEIVRSIREGPPPHPPRCTVPREDIPMPLNVPCGLMTRRDWRGEDARLPAPTLRRMNLSALEGMDYVAADTRKSTIE